MSVTKGSTPSLSVSYNASTNRRSGDSADSNGNIFQNGITAYDVSNRVSAANITNGTVRYSYAPGNKRIWRGTWVSGSQTVDELTFYSAGGAKLCSYNLTTSGSDLRAAGTGYYEYFGGQMIKNAAGYVNQDRLGSIGKFFPYGQERPSATANGKEKFATYFRDSDTALDYAQNRYESSGDGRFLSPDPFAGSVRLGDPGSWNRYVYAGGDPINNNDPNGLDWVWVGNRWCSTLNANDVCYNPGYGDWDLAQLVIATGDFGAPPPDLEPPLPPGAAENAALLSSFFHDVFGGDSSQFSWGNSDDWQTFTLGFNSTATAAGAVCGLQPELCPVAGGVLIVITVTAPYLPEILEAIKTAIGNIKHDYIKEAAKEIAKANRMDYCEALQLLYNNARARGDNAEAQKIKQQQKTDNCRRRR